jgi:hypothetical protein
VPRKRKPKSGPSLDKLIDLAVNRGSQLSGERLIRQTLRDAKKLQRGAMPRRRTW